MDFVVPLKKSGVMSLVMLSKLFLATTKKPLEMSRERIEGQCSSCYDGFVSCTGDNGTPMSRMTNAMETPSSQDGELQ
ncbi:hypothetical protein M8C21_020691 [Ambrosia artemisiifolia]|uniref:Uncharacterized protein n=1 Tax=Ambrosia artemisiifolia TaxID=4212 RepID=A0AAD5BNK0_AMBAR|nr:hypothetical protein M8C21_020691 [Ambrosia artemisiifolia]